MLCFQHIFIMSKLSKIIIFSAIFLIAAAGFFIYGARGRAEAASCYSPFQRVDLEEAYNGSVCGGNFQVYYFPVVTDGRQYTITLRTISGEQKLFASRYKNDVAKLSDVINWRCYGPHCDSSIDAGAQTRFVTFRSPAGDPEYFSWFAVYGRTDSKYQIGLSNNGVLPFVSGASNIYSPVYSSTYQPQPIQPIDTQGAPPSIAWKTISPENTAYLNDNVWTASGYSDDGWQDISLPDSGWYCNNCYRRYRGIFYLDGAPQNLKMFFESDDGIWIYINGQYAGHWGGDGGRLRCVNHYGCEFNDVAGDIALANLTQGKNVISAVVYDGGGGEYFQLRLKK